MGRLSLAMRLLQQIRDWSVVRPGPTGERTWLRFQDRVRPGNGQGRPGHPHSTTSLNTIHRLHHAQSPSPPTSPSCSTWLSHLALPLPITPTPLAIPSVSALPPFPIPRPLSPPKPRSFCPHHRCSCAGPVLYSPQGHRHDLSS